MSVSSGWIEEIVELGEKWKPFMVLYIYET